MASMKRLVLYNYVTTYCICICINARGVYGESVTSSKAGGADGCLDHRTYSTGNGRRQYRGSILSEIKRSLANIADKHLETLDRSRMLHFLGPNGFIVAV